MVIYLQACRYSHLHAGRKAVTYKQSHRQAGRHAGSHRIDMQTENHTDKYAFI